MCSSHSAIILQACEKKMQDAFLNSPFIFHNRKLFQKCSKKHFLLNYSFKKERGI